MAQTQALHQEQTPTTQIVHKWTKELTTREKVEWLFLLSFLVISWGLFVMIILGWENIFGLNIGDGSFGTFISPFLLSYVFYLKLANDKNATTIRIFSNQITIETAPFATPRRRSLLISDVKRLRVVEKVSQFGQRILSRHYEIYAVLKDGKIVSIFPIRLTKEEAEDYLNQIERAIGNLSTDEKFSGGGQ